MAKTVQQILEDRALEYLKAGLTRAHFDDAMGNGYQPSSLTLAWAKAKLAYDLTKDPLDPPKNGEVWIVKFPESEYQLSIRQIVNITDKAIQFRYGDGDQGRVYRRNDVEFVERVE